MRLLLIKVLRKCGDIARKMENFIVNTEGLSISEQKQYNDKLFSFYRNMVPTLGKIEDKIAQCNMLGTDAYQIRNKRMNAYIIIFLVIVSYVIWEWIENYINNDSVEAFIFLLMLTVAILVPLSVHKKWREKKYARVKEQEKCCRQEVDDMIYSLGERLRFIPEGYCNSNALNFFEKEYRCGKVSNLREAMCAYDEYVHRLNMEQGQMMLLQQQNQIIQQNRQIMYNQEILHQEMQVDTALILLASFM